MTGAGFVGARSVAPPPGGAGGGTTPASGHPSLKEGNVRGSLASAGRPCILLRQLSPVRWSPPGGAGEMSPHHPQPPPTQAPLHLQAAPPANRPACKPTRPKRRSARKSLRLQAVPTKDPNHHALSESNATSPPQTAPVLRHSPPLRRGGRRPGWSARDGRQAVADTSRTSSSVLPKRVVVDKACRWCAG